MRQSPSALQQRLPAATKTATRWLSHRSQDVQAAVKEQWRAMSVRDWFAGAMGVAAVGVLTWAAWPLVPFVARLLPDALPADRLLVGAVMAGLIIVAWRVLRSRREDKPLWLGWLILSAWATATVVMAGIVAVVWLVLDSSGLDAPERLSPKNLDAIATRAFAMAAAQEEAERLPEWMLAPATRRAMHASDVREPERGALRATAGQSRRSRTGVSGVKRILGSFTYSVIRIG